MIVDEVSRRTRLVDPIRPTSSPVFLCGAGRSDTADAHPWSLSLEIVSRVPGLAGWLGGGGR